jgi:hypothetical protein
MRFAASRGVCLRTCRSRTEVITSERRSARFRGRRPEFTVPVQTERHRSKITIMMNSDDLSSSPPPATPVGPTAQANDLRSDSNGPESVGASIIRTWVLALISGLAAGVIAWAIGEAMIMPEMGRMAMKGETIVPPSVSGTYNAIVSFSALGAALGSALGLAGGLIRRSFLRACLGALVGLCVGGGAAALTSRLILPVFFGHLSDDDLTYSLMIHGGAWAAVGASAGFAFALGLGGRGQLLRMMVAGAGAALLATVIYEFAGGILSPFAMTNRPVSVTWQSRLAARLIVAVLVSAGLVLMAGSDDAARGAGDGKN